jgi:hypothetical protein
MKDEGTRARPQTLAVQHLPLPGASPGCARPLAKGSATLALLLMLNSSGCCGASPGYGFQWSCIANQHYLLSPS